MASIVRPRWRVQAASSPDVFTTAARCQHLQRIRHLRTTLNRTQVSETRSVSGISLRRSEQRGLLWAPRRARRFSPSRLSSRRQFSTDRQLDVAVIGGGITGLASAYYVTKAFPNARVTIYEQTSRLGGWLQSKQHPVDGQDGTVLFEAGPRSLRPAGNGVLALSLLSDVGLLPDTIFTLKTSPAATSRFIYYPDHLVQLKFPPAPGWIADDYQALMTEDAFDGTFWAALTEAFKDARDPRVTDESVGSFLSRRLSPNTVDRLVSAIFHGVYAGDVYRLSARSLLSRIWAFEGEHGSIARALWQSRGSRGLNVSKRERMFMQGLSKLPQLPDEIRERLVKTSVFTFREGLGQLTDAMLEYLRKSTRVDLVKETKVEAITKAKEGRVEMQTNDGVKSHSHLIWTPSPAGLANLTPSSDQDKALLGGIPSETVMTVNVYYDKPELHPPGFGYLIPLATSIEQNPENALGVVFDNCYAPGPGEEDVDYMIGPPQDNIKSRGTKLTVMLGGHYWHSWTSYPTQEEGKQMALDVLKRHLGITDQPTAIAVNVQKDCIPQYVVGHHERLEKIHSWLLDKYGGAVRVAGSWISGVGVNDCLRSAWNTVDELPYRSKTGLESVVDPTMDKPT